LKRLRKLAYVLAALLAGLLVLWILGPEQPRSGPMLQQVTATSLLITRLDRSPRRVRVTVAPASPHVPDAPRVVTEDAPTRHHMLAVAGLRPATRYRYRIDAAEGGPGADVDDGEFRTAPVDDVAPVRFVAVGDTGLVPWWTRNFAQQGITRLRPILEPLGGLGPQWDLARWMERQQPDFFFHLGDVVYPWGQMDGYEDGLFRPFDRVLRSTPVFAVIGNHDIMTDAGEPFDRVFALPKPPDAGRARYYTFQWGAVRVVALDPVTAPTAPDSPQGRFLEQTLATATERWKLAVMHFPVFCSARHTDDAGLVRDFWPVFARHKVDLVLSGHSHDYQRFVPIDGVVQVIAGAGGHSIHPIKPDPRLVQWSERYSFLMVQIQGTKLTGEVWAQDGAQLDLFTLEKQ
jgi:predicted phosphodiesterase